MNLDSAGNALALVIRWRPAKRVIATVFKDESDRFGEAGSSLFLGLPLTVGAGDLGTVGDVPLAITFENCGELVVHQGPPADSIKPLRTFYSRNSADADDVADLIQAFEGYTARRFQLHSEGAHISRVRRIVKQA